MSVHDGITGLMVYASRDLARGSRGRGGWARPSASRAKMTRYANDNKSSVAIRRDVGGGVTQHVPFGMRKQNHVVSGRW